MNLDKSSVSMSISSTNTNNVSCVKTHRACVVVVRGRSRFIIMISTFGAIIQVFVSLKGYVHRNLLRVIGHNIGHNTGTVGRRRHKMPDFRHTRWPGGLFFFQGSTDKIYRRL